MWTWCHAAVAALCLEVNPKLTPADLRRLLTGTGDPLPGVPESEQGAGVVSPRRAVELARTATASTPRRASADAAITDDRIVAALLDDDPRVRSAGLLALFSSGPRDLAFAESLLPVLRATPTESVCGALAHLRGWPRLRAKVLASGLDRHPSLAVRYNWGRIALAEDDPPARDAAIAFLRSGDVDLMQLAAHRAPALKAAGLSRPLVEAMTAHPDNLQIQFLGRKALESLSRKRFDVPPKLKGASEAKKNEAVLKQWQAWLCETNPN